MARALKLAARGRFWAAPNPHVGCVLARDGAIIGEGFTRPAGGAHAEVVALEAAGDARGATAYVTLEPCNHRGRTGPCSEALVAAGVTRVVVAMVDPNPAVAGGGVARLRQAGIAVDCGLLEAEARALVAGFTLRMTRGRGRVRLKLAMSLDGRTAMASGESKWITGPAARADVQRLRAASCAVVTGVGTVLADDCALTVRAEDIADTVGRAALGRRRPLRVVLDSQLRTPVRARVLAGDAPTLLLHAESTPVPPALLDAASPDSPLLEFGALRETARGLDLEGLMTMLSAREANEILVESGPRLAGALLREGLVDQLIVYVAPCLLGSEARPLLELPLATMAEKVPLALADMRRIGEDWRLTLEPVAC
jgi:diaminohydroxyphosphoribosylaminopyrimidine deaminase/5-amino-6-(5-phosphoribosylamino)uracil reductase